VARQEARQLYIARPAPLPTRAVPIWVGMQARGPPHVSKATALDRSMRVGTGVMGTSGVRITGIVTQASPVVITAKLKPRTCAVKPMPTGGGRTIWHQEQILGRRSWVIISTLERTHDLSK
jgi:hypothetical protein